MPFFRPIRLILVAAAAAVVLVQPALAQNSARIFGIVTDHEGNPVDGASILMEFQGGLTRSFQTSSNAQGEYIQVGLASGPYLVTITAEGIGTLRYRRRGVRAGRTGPRPGTGRPHGDVGRGDSRAGSPRSDGRRVHGRPGSSARRRLRRGGGTPERSHRDDAGLRRMSPEPGHRRVPAPELR
ncbi:MAG: carboxypeptidase regulatory-like domain-containing protein [Acidobacteria bacterium]|nr:carboxypeptidase regulatory-like domain-containing protein [Acidobacteriota bacterium]